MKKPSQNEIENVQKKYNLRMKTPQNVTNILRRMTNEVLNREVDPKIANTVAYICQTALKSMELGDMAARLERIEEMMESKE